MGSWDAYLVPLSVVLSRNFPYLGQGFQQGHSHRIWNCLCAVADHFHNYERTHSVGPSLQKHLGSYGKHPILGSLLCDLCTHDNTGCPLQSRAVPNREQ